MTRTELEKGFNIVDNMARVSIVLQIIEVLDISLDIFWMILNHDTHVIPATHENIINPQPILT